MMNDDYTQGIALSSTENSGKSAASDPGHNPAQGARELAWGGSELNSSEGLSFRQQRATTISGED